MTDSEYLAKSIAVSIPGFIDYETTHICVIAILQKHKSMYEKFLKQCNTFQHIESTKTKTQLAIAMIDTAINDQATPLYILLAEKVNLSKLDQIL